MMLVLPEGFDVRLDFAPWRLSGVVYGTLLNDPAVLTALGGAVYAPPYKLPPRAPVLYLKPRNTLASSGAEVEVPTDVNELEIGASLALVIGRTACRVQVDEAMAHVAGWTLAADLSVPHDDFYRPSVRFKARDGSCIVGPRVVPYAALADPHALALQISIEGGSTHAANTAGMQRPAAQLLQDVTEFMTLRPGDILMLGVSYGAPRARAGQGFAIECAGIGRLQGRLVTEPQGTSA
jgi:5-oxopent-3-ene-1,2,5-tricarboxylate decarboxylase/2-hydroxyhepta-2,4-diene-1,7-dioate isomerase